LALFFQIALEFSAVQGFHICHSREGGNPIRAQSGVCNWLCFSWLKNAQNN
jgi:hypothetical protein